MNIILKQALLKQKSFKESFTKEAFVPRFLNQKNEALNNPSLIKLLKGPRRSGKSTFLLLFLKDRDYIYVNFDDSDVINNIESQNSFLETLHQIYGKTKIVFFDEIQNMPDWELFLHKLEQEGYNIYVTGSSSDLLNTSKASSLTGRYSSFNIFPFNYTEYLYTLENTETLDIFTNFLLNGGFPEIVVNKVSPEAYISDLLYSIIYKDIVKKYNIRNYPSLDLLVSYLISNFCHTLNFSKISKITNIKNYITLKKYFGYLGKSYICSFLYEFNFKPSKSLSSRPKVYFYDNSFLMYKNLFNSENKGFFFENLIFTELLKKGLQPNTDIFYYKTKNNYEIDFVLKQGIKITALVQVCYEINSTKTENREVRSLIKASEELDCYNLFILTKNIATEKEVNGKIIKFIPFSVFYKNDFKF